MALLTIGEIVTAGGGDVSSSLIDDLGATQPNSSCDVNAMNSISSLELTDLKVQYVEKAALAEPESELGDLINKIDGLLSEHPYRIDVNNTKNCSYLNWVDGQLKQNEWKIDLAAAESGGTGYWGNINPQTIFEDVRNSIVPQSQRVLMNTDIIKQLQNNTVQYPDFATSSTGATVEAKPEETLDNTCIECLLSGNLNKTVPAMPAEVNAGALLTPGSLDTNTDGTQHLKTMIDKMMTTTTKNAPDSACGWIAGGAKTMRFGLRRILQSTANPGLADEYGDTTILGCNQTITAVNAVNEQICTMYTLALRKHLITLKIGS